MTRWVDEVVRLPKTSDPEKIRQKILDVAKEKGGGTIPSEFEKEWRSKRGTDWVQERAEENAERTHLQRQLGGVLRWAPTHPELYGRAAAIGYRLGGAYRMSSRTWRGMALRGGGEMKEPGGRAEESGAEKMR